MFLIALPVTSFPYLPEAIGGAALVRPLSLYPLLFLLVTATIPRLFTGPIPRTIQVLLPFILIALASSLLSTQRGIEPMLGVSVTARTLRALLTLGIGCAFYLTAALLPSTLAELRASLRWLYTGFAIALLWGSLQAGYVLSFNSEYYKLLNRLQGYISTRKIFTNRVSGMTYEPNWFAEQISFLLIPWLLASVLSGESVFRWRWKWVTIEWFLLLWSVAVLIFTFSRAGLANLVLMLLISVAFLRPHRGIKAEAKRSRLVVWARRILEAGIVVAIVSGVIYTASTRNEYFSRIWSYWRNIEQRSAQDYFEYIGFGARFMYAEAAYNTYAENPLLGVGLGNYAFYFDRMLPDEFLARTPEVLRILTPEVGRNRLITPKNLYFRILAETGLIGLAAFIAFLVAILGCALYLWLAHDRQQRFWGIGGMLGVLVFFAAAFSFDSFAIPNMWVIFGLITSAAWSYTRRKSEPQPIAEPLPVRGS
jgi:O-antigen ligase